jgi:hypothetical protein
LQKQAARVSAVPIQQREQYFASRLQGQMRACARARAAHIKSEPNAAAQQHLEPERLWF